jgi:hypothetical protein
MSITKAELRTRIRERLIPQFWSDEEIDLYINDALRVWSSLTAYYRRRVPVAFPVSDTDYVSTEIISPDCFAVLRIDRYDSDPRTLIGDGDNSINLTGLGTLTAALEGGAAPSGMSASLQARNIMTSMIHARADEEECLLSAAIPLDMVTTALFWDAVVDTQYTSTQVRIDPADYPGMRSVTFVGKVDTLDSSDTAPVAEIVDETGTVYGTVTWEIQATDQDFAFATATFEISTSTAHYYMLNLLTNNDTSAALVRGILYVNVIDTSRAGVQIPLLTGDISTGGGLGDESDNNEAAYAQVADFDISGSYGYGEGFGDIGFYTFTKDESLFDTIDEWQLRVNAWTAGMTAGQYGRVALFNKTTDTLVGMVEFIHTDTSPSTKTLTIANDATNFTDGDDFEIRLLRSNTSTELRVAKADLWVYVEPAHSLSTYERRFDAYSDDPMPNESGDSRAIGTYTGGDAGQIIVGGYWGYSAGGVQRIRNAIIGFGNPESTNPAILELNGFSFDTPIGSPITRVRFVTSAEVYVRDGDIGIQARVNEVDEELHVTHLQELGTVPSYYVFNQPMREYELTGDRAWTAADFADTTIRLYVELDTTGGFGFFDGNIVSRLPYFIVEWSTPEEPDQYTITPAVCI